MKKIITSLFLAIAYFSNAQSPIQSFNFDNNLSNTTNTVTLSAVGNFGNVSYVTDRNGNTNSACDIAVGQYIGGYITNLPVGSTARSISIWVNFKGSTSNTNYIWSYGNATANNAFGLSQEPTNVINYGWANDHIAPLTYAINTWYNYVVTYDGATSKIYRNGVLISQTVKSWNTITNFFKLGSTPNSISMFGAVDDLKIYDIVLTQAQITNLYSPPIAPVIISYSSFINSTSSAIIEYNVNAQNSPTNSVVRYGTTKTNLNLTGTIATSSGITPTTKKDTLNSLTTNTKYYYKIEATNGIGTTLSSLDSFIVQDVSKTDLVAYYGFEDNFFSYDGLHNLAAGTASQPSFATGKYRKAANFSGQTLVNSSLSTIFANNTSQTDYTICFWEYRTSLFLYYSSYELFGSQYLRTNNTSNSGHLAGLANGNASGWVEVGASVSSNSLLNAWHHYAVQIKTISGSKFLRVYVDGLLKADLNLGTSAFVYKFNNTVAIGGGTDAAGNIMSSKYYYGMLDEMYVYRRALSESEISVVMNNIPGIVFSYSQPTTKPQINLAPATINSNIQATLNFAVKSNYGITSTTVKYSKIKNNLSSTINGSAIPIDTLTNPFQNASIVLSNLSRNTKYYYQVKVSNSAGADSSAIDSFTTANITSTVLIKEFKFDGTRNDITNNLSFSGTSGYTNDRFGNTGKALVVNNTIGSTADNVTIPNLPQGKAERSVSMWFQRTNNSASMAYPFLYGTNASYQLWGCGITLTQASIIYYHPSGNDPSTPTPINTNNWYHLVLTTDANGVLKLYINGNFILSQTQSLLNTTGTTFKIGHYGFVGAVDDLKIFSGVLDSLEIGNLYNYNSIDKPQSIISGRIYATNNKILRRVNMNITSDVTTTQLVDSAFNYTATNGSNIKFKPTKNNDIAKSNGVTSIDVLLTQRHILNTTKLNSPYKIIAADVTGDRQINSTDILRMKRLILGTDSTFTSTTRGSRLWEFVDSAYTFTDTTNPFPFKDSISFSNLTSNKTNQTFIGVKLGDVNYDWNPTVARGVAANSLQLIVNNEKTTNNNLQLVFTSSNFNNIAALQTTLHFDNTKYEFVSIESNKLQIDYNASKANTTGNIALLWTDKNAEAKSFDKDEVLFTVILKPRIVEFSNLEFTVSNDMVETEAWDNNFAKRSIVLNQKQTNESPLAVSYLLIYPNPAKGWVNINCSNAKKIVIADAMGRVVKHLENTNSRQTISTQGFAKGVYLVQAIMQNGSVQKSKLVIE